MPERLLISTASEERADIGEVRRRGIDRRNEGGKEERKGSRREWVENFQGHRSEGLTHTVLENVERRSNAVMPLAHLKPD
jgi:hypothetical protein